MIVASYKVHSIIDRQKITMSAVKGVIIMNILFCLPLIN